jgi:cell division protease FtsH
MEKDRSYTNRLETSYINKIINNNNGIDLSYSKLVREIEDHKISKMYFTKTLTNVVSQEKDEQYGDVDLDNYITEINPFAVQTLLDLSTKNNVETIFLQEPTTSSIEMISKNILGVFDNFFYPTILITLLLSFIRSLFVQNRLSNIPGGGIDIFNKDKDTMNKYKVEILKTNISLNSFSGSPEILKECTEVVSYLKNASLYEIAGAEIPKGILLEGPPGTGKTLLAKAIASETESNFISISGSEFVEIFVGMGANNVRNLFKKARKNKPCIIFIDEIDAVGKQRGSGVTFGNDEREQTLNQILAEMDGFENNDKILVIAATNRKDVLDKALLRPGRFDRIIKVPLPDFNSRISILKYHSKNKVLDEKINLDLISELTYGFSGAQLKNLLNEAAIFAAREGNRIISEKNMFDSLDKLIVGIIKEFDTRDEETQKRVAIHEAGHALLVKLFNDDFDFKKVSIKNSYNGAGGYTIFNDKKNVTESGLYTKHTLIKRLVISLGGKAAEKIMYGENMVSTGAVQDIKDANYLANQMVSEYGMGKMIVSPEMKSEFIKQSIDENSVKLMNDAFKYAVKLLTNHSSVMNKIVENLMKHKTLLNDDIDLLIHKNDDE